MFNWVLVSNICSDPYLGKMNPFWLIFFQMGLLVQPPSSELNFGRVNLHVAAWDQEIAEIQQRIQKTHHATNEKVGIFSRCSGLQLPNGFFQKDKNLRTCISGFKFGVIYTYIYIFIYLYMCIYIYIYIYMFGMFGIYLRFLADSHGVGANLVSKTKIHQKNILGRR